MIAGAAAPQDDAVRCLVVEDSATVRRQLVAMLRAATDIVVVGEATNGDEAIEMARDLRPDVISMDVVMPRRDGLEATRVIMHETPTPIVIVSGCADAAEAEFAMKALAAGALTVLAKPRVTPGDFDKSFRTYAGTLRAMADVSVITWSSVGTQDTHESRIVKPPSATAADIAGIAASTGGPQALRRLLGAFGSDLSVPVLVVQHITTGFTDGFVRWLDHAVGLTVKIAENGEELRPGIVYVAPSGAHLGVLDKRRIQISSTEPIEGHRPSANFLFRTLADAFGAAALGVVLTGMGEDGTEGLADLHRAGGLVFAQDNVSSLVHGMPGAAVAAGVTDRVAALSELPGAIRSSIRRDSR